MTNLIDINDRLTELEIANRSDRLSEHTKPSGEPPDMSLEARVAKLEASVSHIESDISEIKVDIRELRSSDRSNFLIVFGGIITSTLGLAAIMAKGFGWL
jgi:uncharacterized coiled-coil protein SlyX